MATIIDKIKEAFEASTEYPLYYDTPQTLNLRLDSAQFPCCLLNVVSSGAVTADNGIIRERMTIEVLAADLSRLDFDGIEAERQIDPLKRRMLKALSDMQRSRDLQLDSINGTSRYYATDDAIVVAFGVNITLTEREGVTPCYV